MISEPKFYERAEKFVLLKNVENKYFTLEEYRKHIESLQKDKDKRVVYVYATQADEQYGYIESAKAKGYDVLLLDGVLDAHFVNTLEQKLNDSSFVRVDAETAEKLIRKDDSDAPSKLSEDEKKQIIESFEKVVDTKTFELKAEPLSESDSPVLITQNEFMRRMKDMSAVGGGGMMGFGEFPDHYTLIVNTNHPAVSSLSNKDDETREQTIRQLYDLARLSKNLLKGKDLNEFVRRSQENL